MKSQDSLGFLLTDVARLMRRNFQQYLDGTDITLAQARALVQVSRHEGVRQVDLAELLEVQPITLARLLDQLAANGLIERRPAPADRRAYLIYLTPAAVPYLESIRKVSEEVCNVALRGISEQRTAILYAVLGNIRDNLTSR